MHMCLTSRVLHRCRPEQPVPDQTMLIWCWHTEIGLVWQVALEEGIPQEIVDKLKEMGHTVFGPLTSHDRALFGRGQIIVRQTVPASSSGYKRNHSGEVISRSVLMAGSDPRADGCAFIL